MFDKLDANNDGFLSNDELRAGMQDVAGIFHLDEPDVQNMMKACDVNGDGKIDYTEFVAAAMQKDILLSNQNIRAAFNMLDLDGNGSISKEELKQVFGAEGHDEAVWDDIMKEVDENEDSEISFEEFDAVMKSVLRQRVSFAGFNLANLAQAK